MENLLRYFKESCSLDSNMENLSRYFKESCSLEAAKTVLNAPNDLTAMLHLVTLMSLMEKAVAFSMAKAALKTHYGNSNPSSSSGSVTFNMSLLSEALGLVEFHTSRDISSQFSSFTSGGSLYHPSTYQDWAKLVGESHVDDDSFPEPAIAKVTETLWPRTQWDAALNRSTVWKNKKKVVVSVETKFNDLIDKQKQRNNPPYVNFVFVKATCNLCAGKRSDFYLIKVGIQSPTPETVGAILFTQSTSQNTRYDSAAAVGGAIAVGQKFLTNTSKQRIFVIVGVTNLKAVRWFKVCKSGSTFCYLRSSETTIVASNLAGYMCASLEKLGLNPLVVKVGKISYPLHRFLGEGHTSNVHVVTVNNEDFAVKVPKIGHDLSSNILYLKKLCDIKGIPVINGDYSNSMAIFTKPVCSRFTAEVLFKVKLEPHLAELVDTLKFAHGRMVVNRDVCVENVMVANNQFVIVDWGYAVPLNDPVIYAGTTYFASARVLKLLEEGTEIFATEASDDLVSLVQSLSLLVRRNQEWQNKLYALSKIDYAGIRSFWEKYFSVSSSDLLRLALNTNYLELKNSIESWALSL